MHERVEKPAEKKAKAKSTKARNTELTEADAPSCDRFPGIMDNLPELAAEYLSLNIEVNNIEARKKQIREIVEDMHANAQEPVVQGDFFVSEVVFSHSPKKLSPTRLLENGVAMGIIEDSYDPVNEFSYIKISAKE